MRAFLQKKAGATYFSNSNLTANIRKNNLEFIFSHLDLNHDLSKSTNPALKGLTDCFYD